MVNRADHTYKNGDYKRYFCEDALRIYGFFEDYRFLSNFQKCDVFYDGYLWPSVEHAYMVAKCKNKSITKEYNNTYIEKIFNMTCSQVRKWGQTVELRDDWEQVKYLTMLQLSIEKYTKNLDLKEKLLNTKNKLLIEANSWGDQYWGHDVDAQKGENNLGNILMYVRNNLKN